MTVHVLFENESWLPPLVRALEATLSKREPAPKRKHGNIPL